MEITDLDFLKCIIRRKSKRIQRGSDRLLYIEQDIRLSETIPEEEKIYLLKHIELLKPYLKNDDFSENKYNYDNANN